MRLLRIVLVLIGLSAWLGTPANGGIVQMIQVTDSLGGILANTNPSISADGRWIAFSSNRDLTGGNPDTNQEIFLYDVTTRTLRQITNTSGGVLANSNPSIDAGGTRIAFESTRDLTPGSPGNLDGNREIFLYDTTAAAFTQVTDTTGAGILANTDPAINGGGTRIAFHSSRDLTGDNPDLNLEIFLFDTKTATFTQVTSTCCQFQGPPSIDASGTRIAFLSSADLAPGQPGNADGNLEIFTYDTGTGKFTQITNTAFGLQGNPVISGDGFRIAFGSTNNLTPGQFREHRLQLRDVRLRRPLGRVLPAHQLVRRAQHQADDRRHRRADRVRVRP